jgi:putative membrane protein
MRHVFASASVLALLVAAPGLALAQPNSGPPGQNMIGQHGAPGPNSGRATMRPPVNDQDRQFVERAASAGLAEVEAGNLALHRAASTAVREFGRWMVTDHTEMGEMLAHRAEHAGLSAPNKMNEKDRAAIDALQQFHDADFDVHYLADQLDAHKQAMELFKQEAQSGEDPWLRSFAQHMQKMLMQHLAQVEELKSTPESSTARSAEVTVPPAAPMPDAKSASPDLHEGTTPEVRHSLNEEGARRTETEGK